MTEHAKAGETRYDWFDADESTYSPIQMAYKVLYEARHDIAALYARNERWAQLRAENEQLRADVAEAVRTAERWRQLCERATQVAEVNLSAREKKQ